MLFRSQIGFEDTIIRVIYPFLVKIGILWQTGSISPSQEHFISNLIRQKMIVAIDGLYVPSNEYQKKYLLFLPEEELHELSLLFSSYIVKARKNKVIYIGQKTPFEDLIKVYNSIKPDYLLTVLTTYPKSSEVQCYVDKLSETFHHNTILITGRQVIGQDIKKRNNIEILNKLEDLIEFADTH